LASLLDRKKSALGHRPKAEKGYSIRTPDKITAPLTYGVFRPVILLSKRVDLFGGKNNFRINSYVSLSIQGVVTR
jgi:hypothetical protein